MQFDNKLTFGAHVLSAAQVERHSNSRCMIKYHNMFQSLLKSQKMFGGNVTLQTAFRIGSAITISKTISGIEWDIL